MDLLEKANIYIDEQAYACHVPGTSEDSPVTSINAKNDDNDKYENNDNEIHHDISYQEYNTVIEQGVIKDQDGVVDTPSLHGDAVLDSAKEEFAYADEMCEDPIAGADYSSDDSLPVAVVRHEAKPSATAGQVAKDPENLHHTKLVPRQKPSADGGLLFREQCFCEICHYETDNDDHFMSHLKAHAASKSLDCINYTERARTAQVRHIKEQSDGKPFPCDVCSKAFTRNGDLKKHMRIHSGEKSYSCDVCSKSFTWNTHLQKHLQIHYGEKSYSCDICKKAFTREAALGKHMQLHSGKKPYSCDICKKAFTQISNLQGHMRIHSGEKPYACDICKRAFTRISDVERHLRIHTGKKPYACDICKKAFTVSCNLQTHMRIHSGEKPYPCDICKRAFTRKSDLQRHKRIHSGERP